MNSQGVSRRYHVTHSTIYGYSDVVTSSYGRGFLTPRDTSRQRCLSHTLLIDPEPADSSNSRDAYGNVSSYFHVTERHRRLSVTSDSVVEVDPPPTELYGAGSAVAPWEIARPVGTEGALATEFTLDLRPPEITDEVDRVTAQLSEFINYSKPREVRRVPVALNAVVSDVVRALDGDLEEKTIRLTVLGEDVMVDADEQLLRQVLFNLVINAVQAVEPGGHIQVISRKSSGSEVILEVCDNGPGVPLDLRKEIFKPYFTMHKNGTGLGLAVVQQIVLAHGWGIECLANASRGAIFQMSGLKLSQS